MINQAIRPELNLLFSQTRPCFIQNYTVNSMKLAPFYCTIITHLHFLYKYHFSTYCPFLNNIKHLFSKSCTLWLSSNFPFWRHLVWSWRSLIFVHKVTSIVYSVSWTSWSCFYSFSFLKFSFHIKISYI